MALLSFWNFRCIFIVMLLIISSVHALFLALMIIDFFDPNSIWHSSLTQSECIGENMIKDIHRVMIILTVV